MKTINKLDLFPHIHPIRSGRIKRLLGLQLNHLVMFFLRISNIKNDKKVVMQAVQQYGDVALIASDEVTGTEESFGKQLQKIVELQNLLPRSSKRIKSSLWKKQFNEMALCYNMTVRNSRTKMKSFNHQCFFLVEIFLTTVCLNYVRFRFLDFTSTSIFVYATKPTSFNKIYGDFCIFFCRPRLKWAVV